MSEAQTATTTTTETWVPEEYRTDPAVTKYGTVGDLIKGYKSAASFIGVPAERVLKLPEKDDAPEWGEVYGRLGRPEKPDGYGIKAEGADAPLWEKAQQVFHEAGLTAKQAQRLHGLVAEMGGGMAEAYAKDPVAATDGFLGKAAGFVTTEAYAEMTTATLKKEWGGEFDAKLDLANRMVKKYGLSDPDVAKLFTPPDVGGYGISNLPGFVKLMAALGADMAEPPALIDGGSTTNSNSGQSRLDALKADPEFTKRVRAGDPQAKAQWEAAIIAAHGSIA